MARFHAGLGRVEAVLAASFLLGMVGLIFLGGVARILGTPLNWTGDFATALFAWACFLCADIAWRRDGLMSIDLLTARLPEATRTTLHRFNLLLIAGFLGFVVWTGTMLAWSSRMRSFQGIPEISYSWITASLPVGALLLLLTTLVKLRASFAASRA